MRCSAAVWAVIACLMLVALPVHAQEAKDRIAVQRQVRTAPSNILVMFSDGKQPQDLPVSDKAPLPRVTPALAPDGRTLAFSAKVGDKFHLFTWALDAQNMPVGDPVALTTGDTSDRFPAWAPDGKQLAYLATDAGGKISLRVINSDGTGMKSLLDTHYYAAPTWRANGQWILFIDLENNIPTLKNVMLTGTPLPIHSGTKIIAASQAPDTAKDNMMIAVLVQNANGLCDLCLIKPFGADTTKLVSQIEGAKSVNWANADTIIFNATKVGAQAGNGIWAVSPDGGKPRGLNAYTDPKSVTYASMQKADLTDKLPTPAEPNGPAGPNVVKPNEPLPSGPVTIMRPLADATVRGEVPIKVYTQPKVTSVILRINDQFIFASKPQTDDSEPAPYIVFSWNTQQFLDFDPARGPLPMLYNKLLRFPDGLYTLSVQALDDANKIVGKYEVKITVQNSLPDTDFPQNTVLKYKGADDVFAVHGEATLFGATPGQAPGLDAALDVTVRRVLIESRPNGYDMRTEVREPQSGFSLSYGLKEASIPEAGASALYSFTQDGAVKVVEQLREKIYLPLASFTTPLPVFAVQRDSQWPKQMFLVMDLLNRDNSKVQASHAIDGMEWVDGKRTIRIRSEYKFDPRWAPYPLLPTAPTRMSPEERDTRAEKLRRANAPAAGPGVAPAMMMPAGPAATDAVGTVKFTDCTGVRYSWYDYESCTLVRVEDFVLYTFPLTNLPNMAQPSDMAGPNGPNGPNTPVWNQPAAAPPPPAVPAADPFNQGNKPVKPGVDPVKVGSAFYLVRMSYTGKAGE